jgi:glycosyltransferase involved in cell wall biosynthesis
MITYNHERFIAEAIQSVLMQRTNFSWELVIGEDKSTDRTGEIVQDFARRYPDQIRVLPRTQNIGMVRNHKETFAACGGDYIANLDGDDFWTDNEKLQLQADLLDSHPDWVSCFGRAAILVGDDKTPSSEIPLPEYRKPIYTQYDFLQRSIAPACTVMYRNRLFPEFPEWTNGLMGLDWPLQVLNAARGPSGFIDRVLAVYRFHGAGAWSLLSKTRQCESIMELHHLFAKHVAPQHARELHEWAGTIAGNLAMDLVRDGQPRMSRKYFKLFIRDGAWRLPGMRRLVPQLFYHGYIKGIFAEK